VRTDFQTRGLATLSILFLVAYVTAMNFDRDTLLGLGALSLGTLLLCFGYFFIKKSMADENEAVTILTPSLAIVVFGLAQGAAGAGFSFPFTPQALSEAAISGASMFVAYYATMRLYEMTDIANAEFPTLLSAIAIQPLENLILNEPIRTPYFLSSVGFVVTIYFILRHQARRESIHA
jgi:drug/metabolite transporter (DMT)-like permease